MFSVAAVWLPCCQWNKRSGFTDDSTKLLFVTVSLHRTSCGSTCTGVAGLYHKIKPRSKRTQSLPEDQEG